MPEHDGRRHVANERALARRRVHRLRRSVRRRGHRPHGHRLERNSVAPRRMAGRDAVRTGRHAKEIIDGLSKTACIGETMLRRRTESEWINGNNVYAQEASTPINAKSGLGNETGSPHPGGASLAFCDGHVEFVAETVEQAALNAMMTKAGGE